MLIEITDNGIGIAADKLEYIFVRGFTTKIHGHGIGLHYSALALMEMDGQLDANSAGEGAGACFRIELPAAAPAEGNL